MRIGRETIQREEIVAVLPVREHGESSDAVVILQDGRTISAGASAASLKRRLSDPLPAKYPKQLLRK